MNAMAAVHRQEIVNQAAGLELLGEIITWDLPYNTQTTYANLISALQSAGLETKVARALLPRFAFARAAKKMAEQRIIRHVGESENKLAFQFTKEYKDSTQDRFNYDFEATLLLEKTSGYIEVESDTLTPAQTSEMAQLARNLLAVAIENRNTSDVSRVIKRLFEKKADLFPVRESGSVYFVPDRHSSFVDQIQRFVEALNGRLNRFPVPKGTQHGNKSVQEAVSEGIQQMIKDHIDAVESFGTDTRESTINKAIARLEVTKFKIEAYKDYLSSQEDKLAESLDLVRVQMKQKLDAVLSARVTAENS